MQVAGGWSAHIAWRRSLIALTRSLGSRAVINVVVYRVGNVDFLLDVAEHGNSCEFGLTQRSLTGVKRVRFVACGITLVSRQMLASSLTEVGQMVKAAIDQTTTRLQIGEHLACFRP